MSEYSDVTEDHDADHPPAKYIVRERRWPFKPPLQRPWAIVRTLDDKPVGFYMSEREALRVLASIPK